MAVLLDIAYVLLLILASPWLAYRAVRTGRYRAGFGQKFLGLVPVRTSQATSVWLHAVSLGEVSLIGPLVEELKRRHPNWDIVISTTTRTGFEAAQKRFASHTVFYCPLDFSWAVRRAMRRMRPAILILAELELWPNLIAAARKSGAKVAVVNGRLSDRSFLGYSRWRPLVQRVFGQLDLVAAQNEVYAERFRSLGAASVHVTRSLKFDGAKTNRDNPATVALKKLAGFRPGDVVFLAGSTQEPEEELALSAYQRLAPEFPKLRLVLVPRHPERFEAVAELLDSSGVKWQRRSQLGDSPDPTARVLLVDTVGELGAWWGTAEIAYVGGSMGSREGQNMIEPAAYGAAVSFGPRTKNFRDVVEMLLTANAATVVRDGAELKAFVHRSLSDAAFLAGQGSRARQVVLLQHGAATRAVDLLDGLSAKDVKSNSARAAA